MNSIKMWSDIFRSTKGRFFSVVFQKSDGSIRHLNGQVGLDLIIDKNGHLVVKDVKKGEFRKVALTRISSFQSGDVIIGE